jgi:hypothetical protein
MNDGVVLFKRHEFCTKCPEFDPELETYKYYTKDGLCEVNMSVQCKYHIQCKRIYDYAIFKLEEKKELEQEK